MRYFIYLVTMSTCALLNIHHRKGKMIWSAIILVLLAILIAWGALLGGIGNLLRVVLGTLVVIYLPGYRITEAAWHGDELDVLEHTALSFAFSLSVMPLGVFYINLLGVPITEFMVLGVIGCVLLCCWAWIYYRKTH